MTTLLMVVEADKCCGVDFTSKHTGQVSSQETEGRGVPQHEAAPIFGWGYGKRELKGAKTTREESRSNRHVLKLRWRQGEDRMTDSYCRKRV